MPGQRGGERPAHCMTCPRDRQLPAGLREVARARCCSDRRAACMHSRGFAYNVGSRCGRCESQVLGHQAGALGPRRAQPGAGEPARHRARPGAGRRGGRGRALRRAGPRAARAGPGRRAGRQPAAPARRGAAPAPGLSDQITQAVKPALLPCSLSLNVVVTRSASAVQQAPARARSMSLRGSALGWGCLRALCTGTEGAQQGARDWKRALHTLSQRLCGLCFYGACRWSGVTLLGF